MEGGEHALGDADPRNLVVEAERHGVTAERPHADEHRDRPFAPQPLDEPVEQLDVEERLRHREVRARVDLAAEPLELEREVVGGRVDGDPDEERRRRVERFADVVLAPVERGEQPDEADRVDLVDAARARVVADVRRVARHREHVPDALGVGAEQHALEPHHRRVARRYVGDGLDSRLPLERRRRHQRVHSRAGHRVVVDVDEPGVPRRPDRARGLDEPLERAALRRVELDRHDPVALAKGAGETGLLRLRNRLQRQRGLVDLDRRTRHATGVECSPDRLDLRRRRATAAAHDPCAEADGLDGELGEVVGCRVRVDDPAAGEARETDVGQRGEGDARVAHPP
ncbi:MAG: hypothetical protein M5U27_14090 [Gaiella sp.]|nr:hypothetical protein [Gaiella sp.]